MIKSSHHWCLWTQNPASTSHPASIILSWLFLTLAVSTAFSARPAYPDETDTGRRTFEDKCIVCHGTGGKPDPDSAVVQGLGVVPADLSDPMFNSREPSTDWEMVIKFGGKALGLAPQMPAHEGTLTDAEIQDVTAYVKSLADTGDYPPGEMNLMLPIRTKKAFPEDEVVYQGRFTSQDGGNAYKNVLEFEKRFGTRGQAIVELVHESEGGIAELEELELGYKHALSFSNRHIVSAAAVVSLPVEGSGDGGFQPFLAYGREISASWTFQGSSRLILPFESFSDGEIELAGILHYTHSPWPRNVFPAVEVTARKPFDSANGDMQWTAMPLVRVGLTRGGHVALNLGVEFPLSGQDWDHRTYATLLWDFADGGIFSGW